MSHQDIDFHPGEDSAALKYPLSDPDQKRAEHLATVLCLAPFNDVYCVLNDGHKDNDHMYTGTFDPVDFEVLKFAHQIKAARQAEWVCPKCGKNGAFCLYNVGLCDQQPEQR